MPRQAAWMCETSTIAVLLCYLLLLYIRCNNVETTSKRKNVPKNVKKRVSQNSSNNRKALKIDRGSRSYTKLYYGKTPTLFSMKKNNEKSREVGKWFFKTRVRIEM